ncbi:hypothetical protein [Arthrobacter sp. B10-11]|uniref:hypothetical protein n=1 Tax=Arthrobacter sp. B10-11 TaxID=3081160 RepID=UPI002954536F|nr:hypothetical protein [Arthrobacter sp. B10-11]MDV8146781.1 hypothetical protein [Arthrobacter sp. B10-11]
MWSALMTILAIVAVVMLFASRSANRQLRAANGEAYRTGFLAGHVQGWNDAAIAAAAPPLRNTGFHAPPAGAPASERFDHAAAGTAGPVPAGADPADSAPTAPAAPAAPTYRTAESPAEVQARKEKRERQNINVTLYVASLLLVAAGALFVGTSLPAVQRFAGVCLITVLFYGAGLVLHVKAPRLRPAATAFAGTGLALVPVTGLAMYGFAVQDAGLAWLLTSVVGTVAYVVAAVRLESRVLVYLSLTFVVSTAWSGVSVLGAPLVWYFAAMIGLAAAATAARLVKPRWMPPLFLRPIMLLDPFVVPAIALAAAAVPLGLGRGEFALIMALCGTYFALSAAVPAAGARLLKTYGARLTLTLAASACAWQLTGQATWALLVAGSLLAVQSAAVAAAAPILRRWSPARSGKQHWITDSILCFGAQLMLVFCLLLPASGTGDELLLWAVCAGLASGMFIAVKVHGAAEWAPPAALATGIVAGVQLGPWPVVTMLAGATVFWVVRAVTAGPQVRPYHVLASRVSGTLAVPALTAAMMEGRPEALTAVIFSLWLALVVQQLVSAVAERSGAVTLMPILTLAGFSAAGTACLPALTVTDSSAGSLFAATALAGQLMAALAVGVFLFPKPAEGSWRPTMVEVLPLSVAAAAVLIAYAGVSEDLANGMLTLVVLYLGTLGFRCVAASRRWTYWWMARGAATVLGVSSYARLQEASGPWVVAGEEVSLATLLIVVLGAQLVFPLAAEVRHRAPDAVVADVALVLALQTAILALAVILPAGSGEEEDWQRTVAVTVMALSAAASGYVFRDLAAAAYFAPSMLAVLLVFSGGRLSDVELLLAIFAVFCAVMVVSAQPRHAKGAYFASARVLTAALALVFSYDATASPTAVSLTFAGVLAVQHVIRWFMRHRLEQIPFQDAAVWLTLAAQAVLPVLYVIQGGGVSAVRAPEGGRGVVLVELLLLLLGAIAAHRLFAARGALYFCVYGGVFGVVAAGPALQFGGGTFLEVPLLSRDGVPLTLLAASLAFNAAGIGRRRRHHGPPVVTVDRWFWLSGAAVPAATAMLFAGEAADWITSAALLVLAVTGFAASHVERLPLLYPPAAALVVGGSTLLAATLFRGVPGAWGAYLPWLAGCGVAGLLLYGASFARNAQDRVRRQTLLCAGALGVAAAALAGVVRDVTSLTGALLVAATVTIVVREVPVRMRRVAAETGAFAVTVAVQRAVLVTGGNLPDPFWAVQWYVLLASGLAALRYAAGSTTAGRALLGSGAALLGLSGLGILFGGSGGQQLWVLALHAALLLSGLLLAERMFVWWGAGGVALCLMWALRSYTFALLALIAVGLIAFALWKLARSKPEVRPGEARLPERQPAPEGRQDPSL